MQRAPGSGSRIWGASADDIKKPADASAQAEVKQIFAARIGRSRFLMRGSFAIERKTSGASRQNNLIYFETNQR